MRRRNFLLVCPLQIILWLPLASAQVFTVTDLGTLGGYYSFATAVNNRGEVVGYSDIPDHSSVHAFLWTANAGMQDLNPTNLTQSLASSINDHGYVAGYALFPIDDVRFQFHSVTWKKKKFQDLGTLGYFSEAFSINDFNQVVGDTSVTGGNSDAAFLWTKKEEMRDLGTLGGGGASAQSINNLGQVVGGSFTDNGFHAFSWTESEGLIDLGTLGGCMSQANQVNDLGQVVGLSTPEGCDSTNLHAFLWTRNDGMQDLGAPAGTSFGGPGAINILGMVVGAACPQPCLSQESVHAFVWTEPTGWVDLNGLIPTDSGWVLENVSSINAFGQITGQGLINGQYHAFLLDPLDRLKKRHPVKRR